jgi:ADP-ribosylglycohydrolase
MISFDRFSNRASEGAAVELILERGVTLTRGRVEAVLSLVMLGDALGLPVETWSAREIEEKFGHVRRLHSLEGNRYLRGEPIGSYSDDTQLTLAVARAVVSPDLIDIGLLAREHIAAYLETQRGWGTATRVAVERLLQGETPDRSGRVDNPGAALGNGVLMKISPVALWAVSKQATNRG